MYVPFADLKNLISATHFGENHLDVGDFLEQTVKSGMVFDGESGGEAVLDLGEWNRTR